MSTHLKLISHSLCPYVQRAVISLTEKNVAFERVDIDLANQPDWFLALSPLGKTPVLVVNSRAIFESAVILEYLEETQPHPLHPADPLTRAEHRAWMEFGSTILNAIAGLYGAPDLEGFQTKVQDLAAKFGQIEAKLGEGPYFDGACFSLVDAAGRGHRVANEGAGSAEAARADHRRGGGRRRPCAARAGGGAGRRDAGPAGAAGARCCSAAARACRRRSSAGCRERRNQLTHPAYTKPELLANMQPKPNPEPSKLGMQPIANEYSSS